ncbi:M56 family metallopeptidase [Nocardia asiatica]|uniref:M56 family metallopeptidase n=1 Tax=Nocardia asiatica TaxID=209252 RepID=UPI00146152E7|nr:M56 family metallopeptidase [Nocardia asiatica]
MISSVILCCGAALGLLIADTAHDWTGPGHPILHTCYSHLHDAATGGFGVVRAALLVLAAFGALAAVSAIAQLGRSLLRARSVTHEHARLVRIAGRHDANLNAVVVEIEQPGAYCVAGRPDTVVVTRGIISTLAVEQLGAVLAHERAHLLGRHHLVLALTRGLAAIVPCLRLFTRGAEEAARLLEMCADDAAARRHGRDTVREALVALAGITPGPAGALAATSIGLAERVERLAAPADLAGRMRARFLLGTVAIAVPLGPLIAVLMAMTGIAGGAPSA